MAKSGPTPKPVTNLTYEEALAELEAIVGILEGDSSDTALEESMKLFERGQALAIHCNSLLESSRLKVQKLTDESLSTFEEETE